MPSWFGPFEMGNAPPGSFDHGPGATEGNRKVHRGHFEPGLGRGHAAGAGPAEGIYRLSIIPNANKSPRDKAIEEGVVGRRPVLKFVNSNERKARRRPAEERREVDLIVIVNVPAVGRADGEG